MKKLLCLLLTLAMTLSFAACGSKADDKTPEEDDPTQAETNIADKQDEPAADDVDKDDASDATEIEPDANKGEKPDEAQKPAEPTKVLGEALAGVNGFRGQRLYRGKAVPFLTAPRVGRDRHAAHQNSGAERRRQLLHPLIHSLSSLSVGSDFGTFCPKVPPLLMV